jgi:hypothetical protein
MTNVLDKSCRENQNTHFIFYNIFFFLENRTFYETMSKNVVETAGPQMTSQHGAHASRAELARVYARTRMHTPTRPGNQMQASTHKQAHTDQYTILIAFPQQQ